MKSFFSYDTFIKSYENVWFMTDDPWTTIGMPKSVRKKIEEHKPDGQPPYIFIENLIDECKADEQ